jgi:hypothetical protein
MTLCKSPAEANHQTCLLPDHCSFEEYINVKNKAMFQLKHRLARLKTSQPQTSIPDVTPSNHPTFGESTNPGLLLDEEIVVDINGVCNGKPEKGNKALHA